MKRKQKNVSISYVRLAIAFSAAINNDAKIDSTSFPSIFGLNVSEFAIELLSQVLIETNKFSIETKRNREKHTHTMNSISFRFRFICRSKNDFRFHLFSFSYCSLTQCISQSNEISSLFSALLMKKFF